LIVVVMLTFVGLPWGDQRDAGVDLPGDAAERAYDTDVPGVDLGEAEEHRGEDEDHARAAHGDEPRQPIGMPFGVDAVGVGVTVKDEEDANADSDHPDDGDEDPEH
jgi:hypothetical protein